MYQYFGKRLFDLIVAGTALIVLAPLLALLALLVRAGMGAPVLFRQDRPGLHGVPFTLYKFRTMRDTRDAHGNLLDDDARLTPIGRFLRSTSLDELPELVNILKGDMSLVGPRPLLMEYLLRYTPEQMRRHDVVPGLTGWAQAPVATPWTGTKSSPATSGMWTIAPSCSTCASWPLRPSSSCAARASANPATPPPRNSPAKYPACFAPMEPSSCFSIDRLPACVSVPVDCC